MEKEIGPVRPIFSLEDEPPKGKRCERLITGSKTGGMVIDVTEEGIEINGYYTGLSSSGNKFSNLRDPVIIPWIELERLKERIKNPKGKKSVLDRIEEKIDQDYLDTLPIVTINFKKYYIDPDRKERRSVEKPSEVFKWK